jgi:hypothetical protein
VSSATILFLKPEFFFNFFEEKIEEKLRLRNGTIIHESHVLIFEAIERLFDEVTF